MGCNCHQENITGARYLYNVDQELEQSFTGRCCSQLAKMLVLIIVLVKLVLSTD